MSFYGFGTTATMFGFLSPFRRGNVEVLEGLQGPTGPTGAGGFTGATGPASGQILVSDLYAPTGAPTGAFTFPIFSGAYNVLWTDLQPLGPTGTAVVLEGSNDDGVSYVATGYTGTALTWPYGATGAFSLGSEGAFLLTPFSEPEDVSAGSATLLNGVATAWVGQGVCPTGLYWVAGQRPALTLNHARVRCENDDPLAGRVQVFQLD
jgi:hypothetical protein